ncbi:polysaccharide deacetylase [Paenibacillus daejeonensis]|uniref:polysaccharide deacetylase n=1 Tax=Paenibacillus daejeonensis TaxID=135193 RepID=UPI0003780851|nr:polysaccharide deacetylase [Paenibacillus daejeonensis]
MMRAVGIRETNGDCLHLVADAKRVVKISILLFLMLMVCCSFATASETRKEGEPTTVASQEGIFAALQRGERVAVDPDPAFTRPEQKTVYLSFDDGPSKWTPQVLDILKEEQVKATFFVLGEQAEQRGDVVRRLVREGHALGNHTYNHTYDELYGSFEGFWRQIERTSQILTSLVGREPVLLRAPGGTHGHFDAFYFYYLERAGYRIHDWNVDSGDSRKRDVPAADIVRNVKEGKLSHEVHVLMHDSNGHGETVKALPEIISYYKSKGYRFAAYTSTVEPVQYRLATPRHTRSYSFAGHQATLATVIQAKNASESREKAFAGQSVAVRKEAAIAQPKSLAMKLRIGGREVELTQGGYTLRDGRITIPLRLLAEQLDAGVRWDDKRRLAYLDYEGKTYIMNPEFGTIRMERADGADVIRSWPEMHLHHGNLHVPLRAAVELLGWTVSDYTATSTGIMVVAQRAEQATDARPQQKVRLAGWRGWLTSGQSVVYRQLLVTTMSLRSARNIF